MSSDSWPQNAFRVENAVGGSIDVDKEDFEAANEILISKGQRTWWSIHATEELTEKYFLKTIGYDSDEDDDDFFPQDIIIPSRYMASQSIQHNFRGWSTVKMDPELGGKWMMFFDRKEENEITGLTALDEAWQKITRLGDFQNTGVYCATCSTARIRPSSIAPEDADGVICCFTLDYTNKMQVEKAAYSIRKKIAYPSPMYYKTDKATYLGKYRHLGHKCVSIYKHTPRSRLYERTEIDPVWYPVALEHQTRWRNDD